MTREYYVIKVMTPSFSECSNCWELRKYNENQQLLTVGMVTRLHNGKFESDDAAFKTHGNPNASRRIRIVKEHIRQGEPLVACYWIENGKVCYFN